MAKQKEKTKRAAELRLQGMTYKQIAHELAVSIPSVGLYLKAEGLVKPRSNSISSPSTNNGVDLNALRSALVPPYIEHTLTLPAFSDEAIDLLTEATSVAATRVSEPETRERYEFINDQIYRVLARLIEGTLSWPLPGSQPEKDEYSDFIVFLPPIKSEPVIEKSIAQKYDDHDIPEEARSTFDGFFDIWVSSLLTRDRVISFLDEATGKRGALLPAMSDGKL